MTRAIGVDLGTTYTVVATIQDGRPVVIPNAEGQHLTPSVVAFTDGAEPLVGQQAKDQAVVNPQRTVFSIKRRMGSGYRVRAGGRAYTPQEISSFILQKVKADAQRYLGEEISQAVVTVPAYFNDLQRQATKEACALAGLQLMRIINEPTAAALAYGVHREDAHTIFVWDLGGGTFDVSILELGEGIFEVRAVSGDSWLGGDDYDKALTDYLAEEYRRAVGSDYPDDGGLRQRLRELAERAKIELSSSLMTRVAVPAPNLPEREHVELELTREVFEGLTKDLLGRMVPPTRDVLADAGLGPDDVGRVILVGGATRMPAVRALARELLGKEPYRYIDPDEAVAMGAAIQAGMLLGSIGKVVLLDVLPLSLGVETQGGLMTRIIRRNTPLPASGSRIVTTAADYQGSMDFQVLQGERALALDNVSLGHFQLNGIPTALKGVPKAEVAFEVDVDGIAHVYARDLLTDNEVKVALTSTKFLDPQEIAHLIGEAQSRGEEDRENRERIQAGIEADNLIDAARTVLSELSGEGAEPRRESLTNAVSLVQAALASGPTRQLQHRCSELRQILTAMRRKGIKAAGPRRVG